MHQGWFQVAGLIMDFAGFMLLAWEWLVGYRAQRREEEVDALGERELRNLAFAESHVRDERMAAHYKMVVARAEDRIREQGLAVRQRGHSIRLPVFVAALILIAVGFLFQILGSWPGGIPMLGVSAS